MSDEDRARRFVWQAGDIEVIEPEDIEAFLEQRRREKQEEALLDGAEKEEGAEQDAGERKDRG